MRYFFALLLFWMMPALAQSFLPGTEDIPLMHGLTQVEETASFDNPAERMVLISAQTNKKKTDVLKFYKQTLVNLGWQVQKEGQFERGSDSLVIEITPNGKINQIQFRLSQRNP